jgi:hypothetical protein
MICKVSLVCYSVNFNGTANNYLGGAAIKTTGNFTFFAVLENENLIFALTADIEIF